MSVLVTGSSGKVGRATVLELSEAGYEVVHVDRVRPPGDLPGEWRQADLTDTGAVYDIFHQVRPDWVCQIAANPDPAHFPGPQIFQNNVMTTYNVMSAAGDTGVTRLVYAGSEMATGWLTSDRHPPVLPFTEEHRIDSPNPYALSKYTGEVIADSMVPRFPGMSLVTLRINNVIVPGGPHGYDVLETRRKGYPHAGSANYWSYIDVRDVASAFRAALEGTSTGHEVFLIAAADTCLDVPVRTAFRDRFGEDGPFVDGHGDFDSAFDCSRIREWFGWEAKHSWRDASS
ncbi:MAG: NAD-dependent epimerase/dehydratase family protein [Spirochaetaceae bacterium]